MATPVVDSTVMIPALEPASWEQQYLDLMRRVWEQGDARNDRTGVGTRSLFGAELRCSLTDGQMPLMTTKRVFWRTATRELLWFLSGATNIRPLCEAGVEIWTDWPLDRYRRETGETISRVDFSSRIVADGAFAVRWGDLGPIYGKQWTDWTTYEPAGEGLYRKGPGINQVAQVVESLNADPGSRRHIIEGWNVAELGAMALPPCHKTYQFHVQGGEMGEKARLSGLLYQRSCDLGLGFAFNIWSLALLTRMLAQQCDLEPGEAVWMGGDVHLYLNHAPLVEEQLRRRPEGAPKLTIRRRPPTIFDYAIEDFEVTGYTPQPHIPAPVAV